MLNFKRSARQFGSAAGAEIAEAALVLPLVFTLLLGIIWFGRAFNIYSTIQQAAQQGAITAARATCVTCTPGNQFPSKAEVQTAVAAVLQSSNLSLNQIKASASPVVTSCPPPAPAGGCTKTTNNIWVCRTVQLNTTPPLQCGSIVSFQYPFQFYLPFTSLNLQQVVLSAQAQSRMEN
ncbi:MAG: pilus assembly protein [Acidobacteriia bacterium]|nr:pilus assembly protein [Terriglobia bacterium]